jgi:ribosomal protein S7
VKLRAVEEMFSREPEDVTDPDQRRAHEIVNYKTKELAHLLNAMMPRCKEKEEAFKLLKQAFDKTHEAISRAVHIGAPWRT